MLRCTCWLARAANVLTRRGVGIALVAVLHLLHPILHPFEGGALDALLLTAQAWAVADVSR